MRSLMARSTTTRRSSLCALIRHDVAWSTLMICRLAIRGGFSVVSGRCGTRRARRCSRVGPADYALRGGREQTAKEKLVSGSKATDGTRATGSSALNSATALAKRGAVRRRTSGRSFYNYFRDYDPATGRYI